MGRHGYEEVLLVTGFPSFRGRKLVEHLLTTHPRALVHAVVHTKLAAAAEEAVGRLESSARERLVLLEGDAAAIDLGLSGGEYRALAGEIDCIHHAAQVTYPGVSRDMAEQVNVGAMREVIELGRASAGLRRLVVHSSATVSGDREGLVLEEELAAGQHFRTPVEETLARAERMARRAMAELPITVIRPTQIVGDSHTGEVDRFDGPYLLILLIVSSPEEIPVLLPTRGDFPINLVPIDHVVRVADVIARSDAAVGRTFHVADPRPLSARRVFELVAEAGGRRLPQSFLPAGLTRALLNAPGLRAVAKSPRAFLELMATPVTWDARGTRELLAGSALACPPFESYVDALVAYVKQRMEQRRHERAAPPGEPEDPLA
ncbi:MAG: SDR family oxidoreductase [Polyangiaceae bacterium]|nr:SDR family oxidoreductase [Polyangiaceae bacterium]